MIIFTSVLPRAQYGDESAAAVDVSNFSIAKPTLTLATSAGDPSDPYVRLGVTGFSQPGDGTTNIQGRISSGSTSTDLPNHPAQYLKGDISASSSLKNFCSSF